MNTYTLDQERKRAGVETRLRAIHPDVEVDIYNIPGGFRMTAARLMGIGADYSHSIKSQHEMKYNVFALVKLFSADIKGQK